MTSTQARMTPGSEEASEPIFLPENSAEAEPLKLGELSTEELEGAFVTFTVDPHEALIELHSREPEATPRRLGNLQACLLMARGGASQPDIPELYDGAPQDELGELHPEIEIRMAYYEAAEDMKAKIQQNGAVGAAAIDNAG